MQKKRKRTLNLGTIIGWLVFLFAIAGGPIINQIRRVSSSNIVLPPYVIPLAIGGLVLLGILVAVVRAVSRANQVQRDVRLPTTVSPQSAHTPMPPFAGSASMLEQLMQAQTPLSYTRDNSLPSPPRFEPIISPVIVVVTLLGVLLLIGIGLLFIPGNI